MNIQNWITKETISKLILPYSKTIQGLFIIEFNKMMNSHNWIGNIIMEENIQIKHMNFLLILDKYINKYNGNFYSFDIKTQVYIENKNNVYLESYIKNFNCLGNMFHQKYYCVKNGDISYNNKYVNEIKSIIKKN
jgi:hypothetical protein